MLRSHRTHEPLASSSFRARFASTCAASSAATVAGRAAYALVSSLALFGCADANLYLPPGATVPSITTNADRVALIDDGDGVDREVRLTNAFVGGEPVRYWGMGTVPDDEPMDLYVLCRRAGGIGACRAIAEHPPIAVAMPGSPDYAPFGRVIEVEVGAAYAGERIPSVAALEQAVARGLLSAPRRTTRFREIVQVHPDVRLEVDAGVLVAPTPIYAEGYAGAAFDFSTTHGEYELVDERGGVVLTRNVYVLTRDGDAMPLSEPARMADITGDGDTNDSNQVFGVALTSPDYTPLWRMVRVTVPAAYASIDTASDETMAEYMNSHDMFDIAPDYTITPIAGRVVSHEITTTLINCPIQSAPGAL